MIPGEPETICKAVREKEGIPIDDNIMLELRETATSLDVSLNVEATEVM